jgi:thioredoxin 1
MKHLPLLVLALLLFSPAVFAKKRKIGASTTSIKVSTIKKYEGIRFFGGTFQQALAKAQRENKMVFLDAYASWCGPCKFMKETMFPDKKLGDYMNQHYICLAIDMETGEGPKLVKKYPLKYYPTMFFIENNGKIKQTTVGMPRKGAGELLAFAQKVKGL